MSEIRTINLSRSIAFDLEKEADDLRSYLKSKNTFFINCMSSPGAGKTTALIKIINGLKKYDLRIGIMDADIDSNIDASKLSKETNCKSIQLKTMGMCHVDACMSKQGLDQLNINDLDIVFLENVGNLVCPAEFDSGAHLNMTILSICEGDDKPIKYPLIYKVCDLVLISKIDVIDRFNFNLNNCKDAIIKINSRATIIEISAKLDKNINQVCEYIFNSYTKWRKE